MVRAVHLYAHEYDSDDTDELIAAAKEGIAAIERGKYTTISSQADRDALWDRVNARAKVLLEQMQTHDPNNTSVPHVTAHAAE